MTTYKGPLFKITETLEIEKLIDNQNKTGFVDNENNRYFRSSIHEVANEVFKIDGAGKYIYGEKAIEKAILSFHNSLK